MRRFMGDHDPQQNLLQVMRKLGLLLSRETERPKIKVLEIRKKDVIKSKDSWLGRKMDKFMIKSLLTIT
jgi:hypothetical protein